MENRIRELREEKRMTQVRLSIELEITQETISAYESGKHYPSVAILIRMASIFNTSCDYILGLTSQRNNSIPSNLGATEQLLLLNFRKLPERRQERLLAYLEGLLA
jgi:transcriptional regulator with XRE-family HTH domain